MNEPFEPDGLPPVGKTFNQFTYTLRINGEWDNKYTYTDGTSDSESGLLGRVAVPDDVKHTEYIWGSDGWKQTVLQHY